MHGRDVLQALAGRTLLAVEPVAVVADAHEPTPVALRDHDTRTRRARVLAHVCETFLDDPEYLDLLVGREVRRWVDVELDVECAVRREEVDVALQRGVERRADDLHLQRRLQPDDGGLPE